MSYREAAAELVEVNVTFLFRHGQAVRIEDADGKKHWLPVRECTLDPADPDRNDPVTISMPEWLATKEGLV
jgi:hypothetical protein